MKHTLVLAVAAALVGAAHAQAPTVDKKLRDTCRAEARGMTGEGRKAFLAACIYDGTRDQRAHADACRRDAASRKGAERRKFMADCLKHKRA